MRGGTLLLSRETALYPHFRKRFMELGFSNFDITGEEKDSLNTVINEFMPRLLIVSSGFYQCATPYMMGQLLKLFPELNIAAVSVFYKIPADLAMWFIINGVKSYINLFEGIDEFYKGITKVREGGVYISPQVIERIELRRELPEPAGNNTPRLREIIRLICNGFKGTEICDELHISEHTLYVHKRNLYTYLNVRNENELIRAAIALKWVDPNELNFYGRYYALNPLPVNLPKPKIRRIK
jgi:DNA-binding NarL/FixJ family response regulator